MNFKIHIARREKTSASRPSRGWFFIWLSITLLILLISYIIHTPAEKSLIDNDLKVGDIVNEDIIVKKDMTLQDNFSTQEKIRRAVESVIPVYEFFTNPRINSRVMINNFFKFQRQARKQYIRNHKRLPAIKSSLEKDFGLEYSDQELVSLLKTGSFAKIDINQLLDLISSMEDNGIITSRVGAVRSAQEMIQLNSRSQGNKIVKVDSLYDLKDVRVTLERFLRSQTVPSAKLSSIVSILLEFIDVNLSYSPNLTDEAKKAAREQINPVLIKLKARKIILRKGDEVGPEEMRIIKLISLQQESQRKRLSDFFLILFVVIIIFAFMYRFFQFPFRENLNQKKLFWVSSLTLLISTAIYRASLFLFPLIAKNISFMAETEPVNLALAIPFTFGAFIIAFTFNLHNAVIFSFINAVISGIICGWDLKIGIYVLMGNLAACFGIEYYQRLKRSSILKASIFWLLPVNLIFVTIMAFTQSSSFLSQITIELILVAFSAILSPVLANFVIPLWEVIFKLITDLKLIELSNLNLPIFREMLEKAPGTYHHSQMVASLSEAAALELNLSPLLLTAMSLYHDIGKISNPQFFTENHSIYQNPHENLSPRESAKMIITHLTDGMEMADKLKLPQPISNAILEHHGTKLVRFFYDKARSVSTVDTEEFDSNLYRYPGRKPRNIENAIVMMADQVEAASKTLASPSDEEIRNVIHKIINSNIEEEQFDECEGLTFRSLNIIANSFYKKLSSIYHMRISYPRFDFSDQSKNDNSH